MAERKSEKYLPRLPFFGQSRHTNNLCLMQMGRGKQKGEGEGKREREGERGSSGKACWDIEEAGNTEKFLHMG